MTNLVIHRATSSHLDLPGVDVRAFGAVGDGVAIENEAFQAAIDSYTEGGPVYVPSGDWKLTPPGPTFRIHTKLIGVGTGESIIQAQSFVNSPCLTLPNNGHGVSIERLSILGPDSADVTGTGSIGFNAPNQTSNTRIRDCYLYGFSKAAYIANCNNPSLVDSIFIGAAHAGLHLRNTYNGTVVGCLGSNCGPFGATDDANLLIDGANTTGLALYLAALDEGPPGANAGTLYVKEGKDILVSLPQMYLSAGGHGVHFGTGVRRATLINTNIRPFGPAAVPINTIKIASGAEDVRLVYITTDPNGGGDISDSGTRSVWINVNGRYKLPGLATSDPVEAGELWADSGVVKVSAG